MYDGFSPNNDGKNDVWVIEDIHFFPDNKVKIFNRWGDIVYTATGYNNQSIVFDGIGNKGKNEALTTGTYYYEIDLNEAGKEVHTGFLLIRK